MKRIYEASHSVEAHMIVHLLEQEGLRAYVQGEHLQSGAGELPLGNLVAVAVEDEDEQRARAVIREWERQNVPPDPGARATPTYSTQWGVAAFFAGVLLGAAIVWAMYNGPGATAGCPPASSIPATP
ncbi:MAG TPA: DUF2007 domain-containing protein [Steroidobacteraceae bacterium]|jgi:hypothetical protein